MSEKYGMNDLQFGKGLLCTQSNEPHWTEGKVYPLSERLSIQDDDKDVTWWSNEVLNFLNYPGSHRAFDLISLDEEINIDAPNYYTGGIETKDYIRSHNLNFNRGSAIKYATRSGKKDKDKEIEDLKKAINFLQFEIDYLENGIANNDDYANNGVWKGLK